MATITLIIKKEKGIPVTNTQGESVIYLQYWHKKKRALFSTGKKVQPKFFDEKNQTIKKGWNKGEYRNFNAILKSKVKELESIVLNLEAIGTDPTIEAVKTTLENNNKTENLKTEVVEIQEIEIVRSNKEFFNLFNEFIKASKSADRLNKEDRPIKKNTIKHYVTTRNYIDSFSQDTEFVITIDSMDRDFYVKFLNYLREGIYNEKYHRTGIADNTIGMYIKCLKAFLNWLQEVKKIEVKQDYRKWKVWNIDADQIALTESELKEISTFNFEDPEFPSHQEIIDCFLVQCACGLRYSDLYSLTKASVIITPSDIHNPERNFIFNISQKTNTPVKIALPPFAIAILLKYGYESKQDNEKILPFRTIQIYNRRIKEALKRLPETSTFHRVEESTVIQGSDQIKTSLRRYERIGSHTARRTFITHCLRFNSQLLVMSLTNHSDLRSFKKYGKFSQEEKAEAVYKAFESIPNPVLKIANS